MNASNLARRFAPLVALSVLVSCGGEGGGDAEPAPRPLSETGADAGDRPALPGETAGDPAGQAPADPRLVLFDVKTALESARPTQGGYPVTDAFRYEQKWRIHRERLETAFDGWEYRSDGESFHLRGFIGERAYEVRGP
ncbi:MAG: hypothetical protein R3326_08070 [Gemmatimonadota bacterium]|nr:hypothetical protein [Gemmatimonadota bacterium]